LANTISDKTMNADECLERYGEGEDFNILIFYKNADKFFIVNDDDVDLRPIKISLPEPPDWKIIDGFGKPVEDQMYHKQVMPARLTALYDKVIRILDEERNIQKNGVLTVQRIIDEVWAQLDTHQLEYEDEIIWIRKQIWHCHYGYWFFCNGKPNTGTGTEGGFYFRDMLIPVPRMLMDMIPSEGLAMVRYIQSTGVMVLPTNHCA
jgi:hypothetical protein